METVHVKSDQDYKEFLDQSGLKLVDVYSKFAGPCDSVLSTVKKLKAQIGDILTFVQAESDTISALEQYRNRSKPHFLLFADKKLIDVVHGPNPVHLEQTVKRSAEQLKKGESVTPAIDATLLELKLASKPHISINDIPMVSDSIPAGMEQTLMLIKPNAVQHRNEIISTLQEEGFEIALEKLFVFKKEQAQDFYHEHYGKPFFDNLVAYMSSGPTVGLKLFRENAVSKLRSIIGPANATRAREEAPQSLRGRFGSSGLRNGVHAADTIARAEIECSSIFNGDLREVSDPYSQTHEVPVKMEQTVFILRPEVVAHHTIGLLATPGSNSVSKASLNDLAKSVHDMNVARPQSESSALDAVLYELLVSGLVVLQAEQTVLSEEQVKEVWPEATESQIQSLVGGASVILALRGDNAAQVLEDLTGPLKFEAARESFPTSLVARFGESDDEPGFYYTKDSSHAYHMISVFFPKLARSTQETSVVHETTFALIKPDVVGTETEATLIEKLQTAGFIIEKQEKTTLSEEMAKQLYSEHEGKEFFDGLIQFMIGKPVLALCLAKSNALVDFRRMLGPADPEKARETAPDSIRALFGKNVLENAMYGSDSLAKATHDEALVFDGKFMEKPTAQEAEVDSKQDVLEKPQSAKTSSSRASLNPGSRRTSTSGIKKSASQSSQLKSAAAAKPPSRSASRTSVSGGNPGAKASLSKQGSTASVASKKGSSTSLKKTDSKTGIKAPSAKKLPSTTAANTSKSSLSQKGAQK